MADLKINEKTYPGVSEVQIPMADDSGNAKFVLPQDTSWFEQVFKLVGTYPIEELGDADDNGVAPYRVVGGTVVADVQAKMTELSLGGQYDYASVMIVPTAVDTSQKSLVAAFWQYTAKNNVVANLTSSINFCLSFMGSVYTSKVTTRNLDQRIFTASAAIDNTKLPLVDVASYAVNATEARVYLLSAPLA